MTEIAAKLIAMPIAMSAAWALWKLMRVGRRPTLSDEAFDRLWSRHKATYWMTYPACIAGIAFPLLLYRYAGYLNTDWRPAGLGIGLMIALPLIVVAVRTLPHGKEVHAEFWHMYLHRYKAGAAGVTLLFSAFLIVGLVALTQL